MTKTEEKEGVHVNADLENYTKTKSASGAGSVNNGDPVATLLTGMNLDEVYDIAQGFCDKDFDYEHLNDGMARMNLGNRIRGRLTSLDKETDKARTAAEKANAALKESGKAEKTFKEPKAPLERLELICKPIRKQVDARVKEAQKAADAKAKAAEKKKADEANAVKGKKAA